MPKKDVTKTKLSITLDTDLAERLKKECEKRTMKLSNYIEKLIESGLEHER